MCGGGAGFNSSKRGHPKDCDGGDLAGKKKGSLDTFIHDIGTGTRQPQGKQKNRFLYVFQDSALQYLSDLLSALGKVLEKIYIYILKKLLNYFTN